MADFCKQCSTELFGKDYGDMKGLVDEAHWALELCEGCGPIQVDHTGTCVSIDCDKRHGQSNKDDT